MHKNEHEEPLNIDVLGDILERERIEKEIIKREKELEIEKKRRFEEPNPWYDEYTVSEHELVDFKASYIIDSQFRGFSGAEAYISFKRTCDICGRVEKLNNISAIFKGKTLFIRGEIARRCPNCRKTCNGLKEMAIYWEIRNRKPVGSCCNILKNHAEDLKDDPERLSTDFIKKLSKCICESSKENKIHDKK